MRTSIKNSENFLNLNRSNLNGTPPNLKKQLNFTSQKLQKNNISCTKREQDQENLKNNLLLSYIESQNCSSSPSTQKQVLKFSTHKKTSPILFKQLTKEGQKKFSNELIVSL